MTPRLVHFTFAALWALLVACLAQCCGLVAVARAQDAALPDPSLLAAALQWVGDFHAAVMRGDRLLAAGLALAAAVVLLRRFVTPRLPAVKLFARVPDLAAMLLTEIMAVLGGLSTALVAGHPVSWPIVSTALGIGFVTAGGYSVAKKAAAELVLVLPAGAQPLGQVAFDLVFPVSPAADSKPAPL